MPLYGYQKKKSMHAFIVRSLQTLYFILFNSYLMIEVESKRLTMQSFTGNETATLPPGLQNGYCQLFRCP